MDIGKAREIENFIKKTSNDTLRESGLEIEVGKNQAGKTALFAKKYTLNSSVAKDKTTKLASSNPWTELKPGDPKYNSGLQAYKKAKDLGVVDKLANFNANTPDFEIGYDDSLKINYDNGGCVNTKLAESAESEIGLYAIVSTSFNDEEGIDHCFLKFSISGNYGYTRSLKDVTFGPFDEMKKSMAFIAEEYGIDDSEYLWLAPVKKDLTVDLFDHTDCSPDEYFAEKINNGTCYHFN